MSFFDAASARSDKPIDRVRLPVGVYLVRFVDAYEAVGGYRGARIQFDFSVLKGPAPVGVVKAQLHMAQTDVNKQRAENGKIQRQIAAFLRLPPQAVTNEVFAKAVRKRTERSSPQGREILSESFLPNESILAGKTCVVRSVAYRNKLGVMTSFYEFEAFDPEAGLVFEEYDPAADRAAQAAAEAAALTAEAPTEEEQIAEIPEELTPDQKLEQAGWKVHPKNPAYVYQGKTALKREDALKLVMG